MTKEKGVTIRNLLDWIFEMKLLAKYRTKIGFGLLAVAFVMEAMAHPLVGVLAPEYQAWAIAQAGIGTYIAGMGIRFAGQTDRRLKS